MAKEKGPGPVLDGAKIDQHVKDTVAHLAALEQYYGRGNALEHAHYRALHKALNGCSDALAVAGEPAEKEE